MGFSQWKKCFCWAPSWPFQELRLTLRHTAAHHRAGLASSVASHTNRTPQALPTGLASKKKNIDPLLI